MFFLSACCDDVFIFSDEFDIKHKFKDDNTMDSDLKLLRTEDLPPLIQEIPDAPIQLYIRGEMPSTDKRWLAVVGSRTCTPYGRQAVRHLIGGLRGQPVVIVSGL